MVKLLPFERTILTSVAEALPGELKKLFGAQLTHINKVQRLLEWKEIEFYCMRWFKVRWPEAVLFQNTGEFVLGSGHISAGSYSAPITVWAVGGHLFSIESQASLRRFKSEQSVSFLLTGNAAQQGVQADVLAAPSGRQARGLT
jgi:hypothetical protein